MDAAVQDYILQFEPRDLLECASVPWPATPSPFQRTTGITHDRLTPAELMDRDVARRYDLAVVHDALEELAQPQGERLLAQLRNCWAERIILLLNASTNWSFSKLLGLGFKRDRPKALAAMGVTAYTYDLATYNHKRTWNNPRFWANPENFHKYRW